MERNYFHLIFHHVKCSISDGTLEIFKAIDAGFGSDCIHGKVALNSPSHVSECINIFVVITEYFMPQFTVDCDLTKIFCKY
jgi:hypothetical protein